MDLTIHSYGYSELIFNVLQGIAMFRESNFFTAVINTMMLVVGVFYAMQMSSAKAEGQWRQYLFRCIGMVVFVNSLILPKTTMFIKDHVEKNYWKVDNIPLAFALPIGAVESFGHIITMGFEQTFSLVGSRSSLLYYHYGTVFGARLAKEVLEAKIRDPEVVGNMRNFIKRCVILPAMIGSQFTKEELVSTDDIWGLVSKNAGTLARTDMIIDNVRQDPSPTCKEAVAYFEKKFASQEGGIINILSQKFRGAGAKVEYNPGIRQLNKNIKVAISGLYNDEHSVDSILKNNMMINAINSYRSGKYATARAQMHQEAGGFLSGDLAEKTLTGSLAIMKVIVYSGFIFLLPLMIISGGFNKYKSWIIIVFSLSLWPPLYSILNMVIDFAYDPAKVVSYSSWSTEVKKFDSIASLAAGLSISIPFLAYYMTKLGEGGFTQLAGTIMASSNAATSAIAGEKSSGSRGWDNDSIDNSSRHNSNAYKTNHNMEYVAGENGYNLADGSQFKLTAGGNQVIIGGTGRTSSGGDASFRSEEGVQNVLHEGLNQQQLLADSDNRSFTTAKGKTISRQAGMLETIAENTRTSSGYNIDTSTEEGKAVGKVLQEIDAVNETNNYGWRQNAEARLEAHAKLGFDFAGSGAGVSANGSVGAGNHSEQANGDSLTINKDTSSSQSYSNITKALNNDSWTKDKGVTQDMSKGLHESYEETQRAEKQLSQRHENIDTYNKALDYSKNTGASTSKDMYQDVLETHAKESSKSIIDARNDVEARTPAVRAVFNRLAASEAGQILGQIHAEKEKLSHPLAQKTLDNTSTEYEQNIDSNVGKVVDKDASEKGFNSDYIKQDINAMKEINKAQFNYSQEKVDNKYNNVSDANDLQQKEMQAIIDQNEKDRIGKGLTSKILEGASYSLILGKNLITQVGRPKAETVPLGSHSKPSYNNINESGARSEVVQDRFLNTETSKSGLSDHHSNNTGKSEIVTASDSDDIRNIAPVWKQYTGDKPTSHDKDRYGGAGTEKGLIITRISGNNKSLSDGQKVNQGSVKIGDK